MENISDQIHRWDLECVETNNSEHNRLAKKEFTKYITHTPNDKTEMDDQIKGFNTHMHRVIDDYETWTGVPEHLKYKLRDTNGKLKTISEWELQPKNTN